MLYSTSHNDIIVILQMYATLIIIVTKQLKNEVKKKFK